MGSLKIKTFYISFSLIGAVMLLDATAAFADDLSKVQARIVKDQPQPYFRDSDDGPPLIPNHPPISQIPPVPMPEPIDQPPSRFERSISIHDAATGETRVLPWENVAIEKEGQRKGYKGADGGKGGGFEDDFLPKVFNDMYQITSTGDSPWRMNCKLLMRWGDSWYVGSGSMLDAETVLTAGHCVHTGSGGSWADEIWVYPGYDGTGWDHPPANTVGAYGWGHGTYFGSTTSWTDDGDYDGDLGLIRITRAVGMLTGWFGYDWGGDCSSHTSRTYNNASFPSQNCPIAGLHNGRDMYYWHGNFDSCPDNQLQINTGGGHCFDTVWGGMSGSGAYYIDDGSRYIHAICSTSNRTTIGKYCRQQSYWADFIADTFIPGSRGSTFDLQALDVNAGPATIQAGGSTTLLNHLATNPTNGTADGTWTFRVYLSTNSNISSSDTLLSTQSYPRNFGTMSSVRVNMVQVTIPIDTPAGTYWLGLEYDSSTDTDNSNNDTDGWDAVPITVTSPSSTAPPWIYDYDGDGNSDIAIFRGSSGLWSVRGITRVYFGNGSDITVPGDYDGDGTTDIGIFRSSSGLWAIRGVTRAYFGSPSDLPVPGDYDGDGCCDAGVFRESSGLWALRGISRIYFGGASDEAVPGYYNGDTSKDVAVFRAASGLWALRGISRIYFGGSTDNLVPGDYNGNGSWDISIFRPSSGLWAIRGLTRIYFGGASDQPVPADFDGNAVDGIGIFRPSSGLWAIRGLTRAYYGSSGDIPVTR